ncbi:hypothetical protein D3C80_1561330 [compost metagenome]
MFNPGTKNAATFSTFMPNSSQCFSRLSRALASTSAVGTAMVLASAFIRARWALYKVAQGSVLIGERVKGITGIFLGLRLPASSCSNSAFSSLSASSFCLSL